MTIDEAIAHAREVAEENYLQSVLCHANHNDKKLDDCIKCAKEHEQLAEWLEELKELRSMVRCNAFKDGYNKAIDDFAKNLYKMGEYKDFDWDDIFKFAEQLKEK